MRVISVEETKTAVAGMETRTIQQMVAQYSHCQPSGKVDMKRLGNKLVGTYLIVLAHHDS